MTPAEADDAILVGGPRDGTRFASEQAGLLELEIDGMHRYVRVGLPLPRRPERSGVVPPWLYDYAATRRWIGYDREMRDVDSILGEDELLRELGELHRTRHDTLRHGSDQALAHHDERLAELEDEYRRRFPQREVDPERLRDGARTRTDDVRRLEDSST
jgi:hypothetical protein